MNILMGFRIMTDFRKDIGKQFSRGLRNNNPGNIKQGATPWNGQVGKDSAGLVIFDSVENGIRALAMNLVNQQRKRKLNTLNSIFDIYAPSSDNNNPRQYALMVGNAIGVNPNENFVISQANIRPLIQAIISVELGKVAAAFITPQMIDAGISTVPSVIMAWLGANPFKSGIIGAVILVAVLVLLKKTRKR